MDRRSWRCSVVLLVLPVLLVLVVGCAGGRDSGVTTSARPIASSVAATTPPNASSPASETPSAAGSRVAMRTHCGVVSITIEGHLWLADPPLGDHHPPTGWDDNVTPGSFLVASDGQAVFLGDGGQRAMFRRAPDGTVDPGADCV